MEIVTITIQIEPEIEDIIVVPEKKIEEKTTIYINKRNEIFLINERKTMEIIESFGDKCKWELIGKTDFVQIYSAENEFISENEKYLIGDCMILKKDYLLEYLSEEEIAKIICEYKSHLTMIKMGTATLCAYQFY